MEPGKRRRALLIGINYTATPQYALRGCIRDVERVRAFLTGPLVGMAPDRVRVLTDAAGPAPVTRAAIMGALHLLCQQAWTERLEGVVLQFSGHGTRVADRTGDEDDGMDECLVTSDLTVIDDDFLSAVIRRFPPTCKVFGLFDECHSGTICDMPYTLDTARRTTTYRPHYLNPQRPLPPVAILSGCRDDGTSAESLDPRTNEVAGALTTAFLELVVAEGRRDLPRLAEMCRERLAARGFAQVPILSASVAPASLPSGMI